MDDTTTSAPVAFSAYAGWLLHQPRLRDALDMLTDADHVPADAGSQVDVIAELAAAREG